MNAETGPVRAAVAGMVLAACLAAPGPASANLFNGSVSSVPQSVDSTRSTVLRVRWQMTFQNNGGPGTVYSTSGVLGVYDIQTQSCQAFYTVPARLEQRVANGLPAVSVTFDETVTVPAAAAVAARRQGLAFIDYCRRFQDDDGFTPGNLLLVQRLPLQSGGLGGELGLNYVRLRFDDGSVSKVVNQNARLGIGALLRYSGRGLVRAVWEVADPASTRGTPHFRVIKTVHRYLAETGEETLEGPVLPTALTGLYLVRLRFLEPAIPANRLLLRYFVQRGSGAGPPLAIAMNEPVSGARLGPDTRFRWIPVDGAAAYRIEFHRVEGGFGTPADHRPAPDSRPAAGLLVAGSASEATVSRLVRERLSPGDWFWRVVAFDAEGRRIAVSDFRRIRIDSGRADGGGG